MTVPVFSQDEMIQYIKANGWEIVSQEYWDDYNRLIFGKEGRTITFQCANKYFYIAVVKTCRIFKIPPPQEHIHAYYLHMEMQEHLCYCGSEKMFKDCHGGQ